MSKEYNDRWNKPLRETYRTPDVREDFVAQLAAIVAPLQEAK